ncbi:hypothetical protein KR52_07980 [Synechococcus sp. KORDI-52]|uniref:hypothetical protein n=1 Tax=Synechococcus sp. KORDI-52 TaxID=585425 RepID=UPI0004E08D1E|nr:hypothetical protein [Synechococcus sp. KORDI-52]AII49078.1 hypothetical protein KR52_07980 [Synechococcus sp. KORDI-52]
MRFLVAVALASVPVAAAGSDNSLITQFCRTAVNAELQSAGKVPPEGMVEDTCRCFLAEVQDGAGIQAAQATCKAEAAKTYGL